MNLNNLNQHLLTDRDVINYLVNEVGTNLENPIVEIGPGTGNITNELVKLDRKIFAVEKDKIMANQLQETYGNKINVINKNIINYKLPTGSIVVGNIPFNITEPLIEKLIKSDISYCLLIFGSNFGNKIIMTDTITKLGLLVNCFFQPNIILNINKKSFSPIPRTNAELIKLVPHLPSKPSLKVMREIFLQRNKLLKNSLLESLTIVLSLTKNESRELVGRMQINFVDERKLENLNNQEIALLFRSLEGVLNS